MKKLPLEPDLYFWDKILVRITKTFHLQGLPGRFFLWGGGSYCIMSLVPSAWWDRDTPMWTEGHGKFVRVVWQDLTCLNEYQSCRLWLLSTSSIELIQRLKFITVFENNFDWTGFYRKNFFLLTKFVLFPLHRKTPRNKWICL